MISFLMGRSAQKYLEDKRNPIGGVFDFATRQNDAGVEVTRDTILSHPAVWRSLSLVSTSAARIPINTYQRLDGNNKEVAKDHPAEKLLRYQPNAIMGPFRWKRLMFAHAILGNAYSYIDRDDAGRPIALIPIDPETVTPYVEPRTNRLWFLVNIRGSQRKLDQSQVFYLQGLALDSSIGVDVVSALRNAFALAIAQRRYRAKYFKNNARPNVALEVPPNISPVARANIRESFTSAVSGLDNAHKVILLEEGVKLHEYSANLRDNQLVEIEAHELVQIANIFGLPPHKVGAATNTSYKSLSEENQAFLDETLEPLFIAFEEEAWSKLLSTQEQDRGEHFFEFNRRAAVKANMQMRAAFYQFMLTNGVANRDEVRGWENLNAIPDGSGQEYLIPLNMGKSSDLMNDPTVDESPTEQQQDPSADPANNRAENLEAIIRAETIRNAGRMVKRLAIAAAREARKGSNFVAWTDTIDTTHGPIVREALAPTLAAITDQPDTVITRFIEQCRSAFLSHAGVAATGEDLAKRIEQWAEMESRPDFAKFLLFGSE